jgi:hypothetical protein
MLVFERSGAGTVTARVSCGGCCVYSCGSPAQGSGLALCLRQHLEFDVEHCGSSGVCSAGGSLAKGAVLVFERSGAGTVTARVSGGGEFYMSEWHFVGWRCACFALACLAQPW